MNFDVIIAGGGPTGLWLACELALTRVRVAVLEKLTVPTGLSKALGLQSRTMEMLDIAESSIALRSGIRLHPF